MMTDTMEYKVDEHPVLAVDDIQNRYDGVGIYCNPIAYGEGRMKVVIETVYQKIHDRKGGLLQIVIEPESDEEGNHKVSEVSNGVDLPWCEHNLGVSLNGKHIRKGWFLLRPEIGKSAIMVLSEKALPFENSEVL